MTELPNSNPEFILNSGLNVVWGPSLEHEDDYDGRSFEPMTKQEITHALESFFEEITKQGGNIVDALDIEYKDEKPLGGIYGNQKATRKQRVYIIQK